MKYIDGQPNFTPMCEQCKKPAPKARPYGPGKTLICYGCAHNRDPELTAIAEMYEREAIKAEIEAKLAVLRAAFPDARIIRLDPDSLAEALANPDFQAFLNQALAQAPTDCDCPVCSLTRNNGTQH
jgi:hypothetical protein